MTDSRNHKIHWNLAGNLAFCPYQTPLKFDSKYSIHQIPESVHKKSFFSEYVLRTKYIGFSSIFEVNISIKI